MNPRIIYRDSDIAVAYKPAGFLSEEHASLPNMPAALSEITGGEVLTVHRLDRETQGLMVYALNRDAAAKLSEQIRSGSFQKTYLAAVEGVPQPSGEWNDLLYYDRSKGKSYVVKRERRGVKSASLSYERIAAAETDGKQLSLLSIRLHTGRTHQIRVQAASRGFPVVGDRRYGSRISAYNIALCSSELVFSHPADGREMRFSAEPENPVFALFKS